VWIKLIVDVIASAYLGGEGVISLLIAGLDQLFREAGVFTGSQTRYPTPDDLLAWLSSRKLRGRSALWQASAERILLALSFGEFGSVMHTQDNSHLRDLLSQNVVLEMDGLSSNSDRKMFSEALALYVYRDRLAQGPKPHLTNLIVLEEAHNLLLRKPADAKESILENSIRMIRQYGMGYVFVDQSASLLSRVAFANSYATLALSQKLRSDVQALSGAMNLTDDQKQALTTLPVGTAIVRLADEYPEPFLLRIPRAAVNEGSVSDVQIRNHMKAYSGDSALSNARETERRAISPFSRLDRITAKSRKGTHPPSPRQSRGSSPHNEEATILPGDNRPDPPGDNPEVSREEIRLLADVASRPLSGTVSRYQRLHLSRRKGNAIRKNLAQAGLIEPVRIATRCGQVVLYQITEEGRSACHALHIDPGPESRQSLEHRYWVRKAADHFEKKGYNVTFEHPIRENGAIDVLAQRGGERVAIEVETGKSDIAANLSKLNKETFDKAIIVATSPQAVAACQKAITTMASLAAFPVEQLTWLDVS
jgi:hypothetical protein